MMVGHMIPKQYKRQDCVNTTNETINTCMTG